MKRKIIQIDEEKCNGCGICIPNCHEGAMQLIDGKARLISNLFCDGLGACIGHCPEGAIEIIARETEPYDERKVMEMMVPKGRNTILAHLEHLHDHNETEFLQNAASELRQWPVQLHLLNPQASYFKNADVVLAADCAAFSMGNFHARFLKGKSLAIACPKLDTNKESYVQKLTSMIAETKINSLTVVMMEVPCCGGLLHMAQTARTNAGRNIPIKQAIVSIQGEVMEEDWT
jgi:ferredoxin